MSTPTFRCPNCDESFLSPAQSTTSRVFCPHCSHSESADKFELLSGEIGQAAPDTGERVRLPTRRSEGIRKYKEEPGAGDEPPVDASALSPAELKVLAALGMNVPETAVQPKKEESVAGPAKLDRSGQVKDAILDRSELIPIKETESTELPPSNKIGAVQPAGEPTAVESDTRPPDETAKPESGVQKTEQLAPVGDLRPEAKETVAEPPVLTEERTERPPETSSASTFLPDSKESKPDEPAEKIEIKKRPVAEDIDIIVQGLRTHEDEHVFESWNDAGSGRHSTLEKKFTVAFAAVTLVSLVALMCFRLL